MIYKFFYFLSLLLVVGFSSGFSENQPSSRPYVLVSVPPHRFFVEKIAGDTVEVGLLVPAGASAHTFEPTPKLMMDASRADLWFIVGESFEKRALPVLQNHNPRLVAIDLRQGLDLIYDDCNGSHHGCCHCSGGADLHYWLSARMAKQQAKTITDALAVRYPENASKYLNALENFKKELDDLDQKIIMDLSGLKRRVIMVSHPAYAYFCRDYQLRQLSIECEGKDPAPQQLTNVIQQARKDQISKIYIQPQYTNRGAKLVAKELGAKLVMLNPYSEDYLTMMQDIALHFAEN